MSMGLTALRRHLRRLSPNAAEVWFMLPEANPEAEIDLRGRLVGPKCAGVSTIEVAYPLGALAGPQTDLPGLVRRVVIPEPGLWDTERPFLYEGPIELVESGQVRERLAVTQGFRVCQIKAGALVWNGRPLMLRGCSRDGINREEPRSLKDQGYNLVVASSVEEQDLEVCDRLGMLVLVRCTGLQNLERMLPLAMHASLLGCVVPQDTLLREATAMSALIAGSERRFALGVGVDIESALKQVPAGITFAICPAERTGDIPESLPRLLGRRGTNCLVAGLGSIE